MSKRDKTLKDILDLILYENPSTQDEIAEKLGITRRYVTQLLRPLVKDGTVKRAYMIDLKSYEKIVASVGDYASTKNTTGNALINDMLENMAKHVHSQLETSFDAVLEYDEDKCQAIETFPIPNSKTDLLEFLTSLKPRVKKVDNPLSEAYFVKYQECI